MIKKNIGSGLAILSVFFAAGSAFAGGYQMPIVFSGYTNRTEVLTNFSALVVLSNNVGGASGLTFTNFLSANTFMMKWEGRSM